MQRFKVQIPPDALRRSAPAWIWRTFALALWVPVSVYAWICVAPMDLPFAVGCLVVLGVGSVAIAKDGWSRFFPTRVAVGDDGVHIAWRWGAMFLPIATIRKVHVEDSDVVVVLESGERCVLGGLSAEASGERDPLRSAIAAAIARRDARAQPSDLAPRLSRGGRTLEEWLAALRANARSSAYRGAGIPRDELLRIAEDTSVLPSARVGAALALGRVGDAERARLRAAADASASPAVREALPLAAGADDEEAPWRAAEMILRREPCE